VEAHSRVVAPGRAGVCHPSLHWVVDVDRNRPLHLHCAMRLCTQALVYAEPWLNTLANRCDDRSQWLLPMVACWGM
jgi:hypothetical protein